MLQTRLLIVLSLVLVALDGRVAPLVAQAAVDVFDVSGIPVDVTAADAVTARQQALLEGQAEGLRRLMRRLTPEAEHGSLPWVETGSVERYVRNFEIASEEVAANQYRGQLNVSYDHDAVRELLQGESLAFAETASQPIVVLPLYQGAEGTRLWPEGNPWWRAWAENLDPERLLRLVLPLGDLEDSATVTVAQAEAGDAAALSRLARQYGAEEVLLIVATPLTPITPPGTAPGFEAPVGGGQPLGGEAQPDGDASRAGTAEGSPGAVGGAAPAFQVEMRRVGVVEQANPPETIQGVPGQTMEALMGETVVGLQNTLDERWKNANLLRYDQTGLMVVDIPIVRLADWVEISRGLQGLPEVSQVEIATFARDNVRAQIRYLGDQFRLEQAFARIGLALSREGEEWLLRPSEASLSPGAPPSETSTSF